jgi:uncharacterized membrane protein
LRPDVILLPVIESLILKLKKMKKILVFASALIIASGATVFGQTQQKPAEKSTPPKTTTTTSTVKQEPAKATTPATQQAAKTAEQKTMIAPNQLPKTAQDYLTKTYPGNTVDQAMKVTEANGTVNYIAKIGSMMFHFDSTGKFLKETKMEEKAPTAVNSSTTPAKAQPTPAPKKETAAPAKK